MSEVRKEYNVPRVRPCSTRVKLNRDNYDRLCKVMIRDTPLAKGEESNVSVSHLGPWDITARELYAEGVRPKSSFLYTEGCRSFLCNAKPESDFMHFDVSCVEVTDVAVTPTIRNEMVAGLRETTDRLSERLPDEIDEEWLERVTNLEDRYDASRRFILDRMDDIKSIHGAEYRAVENNAVRALAETEVVVRELRKQERCSVEELPPKLRNALKIPEPEAVEGFKAIID